MQKRLLILFISIILISSNVYSVSLFPKDNIVYNIVNLKEVHISNNIIELVLESNSNYKIDGIIVNINNNDNIIVNNQLNSYETKIYTINTKEVPNTIEIRFYNDINHKRNIINQVITYRITGNEENIIQQQEQILIQENQQIQQEFNNNPSYISYSSYSKLDDNKNIIYFTKDHISSNRITTNQQGNIEFQANYMPYGKIFKEEGQEQYKYSNKELDNSNLYYFGARYYDPSIGRFTQVDPIFKSSESPYMYANNNPIKYVDPTGSQTTPAPNVGWSEAVSLAEKLVSSGFKVTSLNNDELYKLRTIAYRFASQDWMPLQDSLYEERYKAGMQGTYKGIVNYMIVDSTNIITSPDILAIYLNIQPNTLPVSEFRPTAISTDTDETVYYSIKPWSEIRPFGLWDTGTLESLLNMKQGDIIGPISGWQGSGDNYFRTNINLNNYIRSFGKDEKGVYLSIYDIWDFKIGSGGFFHITHLGGNPIKAKLMDAVGTPIHFYDRYYLNEQGIRNELQSRSNAANQGSP